jgi:hypothetical protein
MVSSNQSAELGHFYGKVTTNGTDFTLVSLSPIQHSDACTDDASYESNYAKIDTCCLIPQNPTSNT